LGINIKYILMRKFYKKPLAVLLMLIGVSAYAQFPAPYCNTTFTSSVEPITLVNFAGINNVTVATIGGPSLEDFTAMVGNVTAGVTYPISVNGNTDGAAYTNYFRVFIDWNQNNVFTDAGESYDIGTTMGNNGSGPVVTGSITVPVTALGGNTRMRVMKRYAGYSTNPCQTGTGYGQAEDYTLSVTAAADCNGAPTVGTATASVTTVCNGISFTLGAEVTPAPGLTYQWESSIDDGTTWTPLGAVQTNVAYSVASQSAGTSYRVIVTCTNSSLSTTSAEVAVAQTPPAECYCSPAFNYNCSDGDLLLNVTIGSINNTTGCSGATGYMDYAGTIAAPFVDAGSSLPISVTVGPSGDGWLYESSGIWIDYNQNGVFEAAEYTYIGTGLNQVLTASVTIPTDALDGTTKMRVVASATTAVAFNATYACGPVSATENYGEMEDYAITIHNELGVPGFETSGFAMYPNPTNGILNLQFGTSTAVHAVKVYSMSGRLVHSQEWNDVESDRFELNLQGISSGVYIVKVETAAGILNKRLIKQ